MSVATVWGAPEGWDAVLLARRLREHPGPLLHVARDDSRMARMAEALGFFAPHAQRLRFPAWDCLPYDRVSPNPELVSERVATLARLLEPSAAPRIVLTTVNALVQRVPPREVFRGASMTLATGGTVAPEKLAQFLEGNGYGRANTVMEPGEYAIRGGIIDLFPAGRREPVRLDLFGDIIESIRAFDPGTQRSGARVDKLALRPVSEVFLDPESVARFRTGWRDLFGTGAAEDPLYLSVSEGRRHPGMEHWVPLFHDGMETLLDYLPGASVSLDHQAEEVLAARLEMIADHYAARRAIPRDGETPYRPLPPDHLYLDRAGWDAMLAAGPAIAFAPFGRPDGLGSSGGQGIEGGGRPAPILSQAAGPVFDQLRPLADRWADEGRRLMVAAWTRGSRERIANLLREHGFKADTADDWQSVGGIAPGTAALVTLGLERGFVADDPDLGRIACLSEQDLLGERISRPPRRRKRADQFIAEATEIAEGDLVVHQDHGIGRYDGLVTLTVNDAPHDCLRLLYDGDDKLFLPVENIEMLSRFGSEGAGVALDKLGGTSWQTRKAKAKQRIRDMAAALIRTAAERRL
ncbi:MAG TPA: CarD family transcriptional regulator, partial [Acetobacteraceae bacterium]|nr:CarD family transcriptional regulator [Acetobacteraceae bacterium]